MNVLIDSLTPTERKILPFISKNTSIKELQDSSKLSEVEVTRATQWLQNKKIATIKEEKTETITLGANGRIYLKQGLPEKRLLKFLTKPKTLEEIKSADLNKDELSIALGTLKKKAAIRLGKKISITENGKKLLKKESLEELFLKELPKSPNKLTPEERYAYNELKKRKEIINLEKQKTKFISLTSLGKKLPKKLGQNYIEALTPQIISKQSWKNKKFRRYDIKINVPKTYAGKRHFVNQAIQYAKRIWMDLGFKEMTGPILNTSFWNFDALFTAQDHPVRELQDTFYIKNPSHGRLPNKKIVTNVRKTHEDGWTTKSKGWQYRWDEKEAVKNVLRTHTTVLSAQTLAKLKEADLPAKFFAVGKCFRNETVDWSHHFEFNQTEGIVVDPDANFRHLLGYLKTFFRKMGYEKARFRPAYFPYTEMSVEIDVFHPTRKKWLELGGAGIFRPEVVKPLLGKDIPVLAWGPGFDRTIMEYCKIKDIRDLYKNDIKQLREMKMWLK